MSRTRRSRRLARRTRGTAQAPAVDDRIRKGRIDHHASVIPANNDENGSWHCGVRISEDAVRVRQEVRRFAVRVGFGLVEVTKIVTAAGDIAVSALGHGKRGHAIIDMVQAGARIAFEDNSSGISDVEQAPKDGYIGGERMRLDLGGARRLCFEFAILSELGKGTGITAVRWK